MVDFQSTDVYKRQGLSTTDLNTGSIYLAAKERDLGIGSIISDSVVEIRADHVVKAAVSYTHLDVYKRPGLCTRRS